MAHRNVVREGTVNAADRLATALVARGLDAESYYSGGGIVVVNVVTRRGTPQPVRRMGQLTADLYAEPLDYLTIGDGADGEPFGWDLSLDGEYTEESGYDPGVQDAGDPDAVAAWLRANLARIVAEGRCADCGNPNGWHIPADDTTLDTRDGLGCILYPYVPDRPGMIRTEAGHPVRASRP